MELRGLSILLIFRVDLFSPTELELLNGDSLKDGPVLLVLIFIIFSTEIADLYVVVDY